ncbi:MAG: glycosyl transferase, partial [Chloroflexi bacterium RBG_16_52_11]
VLSVFENTSKYMQPTTRLIINYYSRLWQVPLNLAQKLNLAKPMLAQNWLTREDIDNLLYLTGFQPIRTWEEVLCPFDIPGIADLCNKFVVKFWPFKHLAITNFTIARRQPHEVSIPSNQAVSIIIPARNEAENIPAIFDRVPEMGKELELVFVEGHSKDNTFEVIEKEIINHPDKKARLIKQPGIGKGDAVQEGIRHASGEMIMILDADLTVPPEDLPMFYNALASNKGEFANGSRLVYPMQNQAMRFLNLVGNKVFTLLLSWLMGQHIKDTLCGTKAFWKSDYRIIETYRNYFGNLDPFGDFDLLFGAAKLNKKIVDIPVRYRERTYGKTNIQRWKHGYLLIRMTILAASKLKFK